MEDVETFSLDDKVVRKAKEKGPKERAFGARMCAL
jgi:hypothetical protein